MFLFFVGLITFGLGVSNFLPFGGLVMPLWLSLPLTVFGLACVIFSRPDKSLEALEK